MNILSTYINKQVISSILLVLLLILSLDILSALIDQTGDFKNEYDFFQAVIYVLLMLPGSIHEFLPISALIGCMISVGLLVSTNEIIIIRSCGVSLYRLIWLILKPSLFLIFISLVIGEFITPSTDQWASSHKDLKISGKDSLLRTESGLWHREDESFMHFNVVQPGGVLYGVTILDFDNSNNLIRSTTANRASYQNNVWLLEEVTITSFNIDSIEKELYLTKLWNTELTPLLLSNISLNPDQLSIKGLSDHIKYLKLQGLDSKKYELAFWEKCFHPFIIISLVLIAVSFVFGPLRSTTMGYRIFIGVVVGIIFQFTQKLLGPSSLIYGFSPLYAVLFPIFIFLFIGLFVLSKIR